VRAEASVETYILSHSQYARSATKHSTLQEQTWDLYLALQTAIVVGWLSLSPDTVCPSLTASVHLHEGVESISEMEAPVWHIPLPPSAR
jgi:hypothetical protein